MVDAFDAMKAAMGIAPSAGFTHTVRARPTDDDLVHISCCDVDAVALCGQGLDGDSDEGANCIVCRDLEDRNDDGCPVFGRCRY